METTPPAPFLDATTFASWASKPAWAIDSLAASLLQVVSAWIRDHKPDVDFDDPAARVVTFEVTRDSLLYGDFGPVTQFQNIMGPRTRSATIDVDAVSRFVTDRHRRMLGISVKAAPRGNFRRCDY